jgi:hypothetical protein
MAPMGKVEIVVRKAEGDESVEVDENDGSIEIRRFVPRTYMLTYTYDEIEYEGEKKYGVLTREAWYEWDNGAGTWRIHRAEADGPALKYYTKDGATWDQWFRNGLAHRSGGLPASIRAVGGGVWYEYIEDGVKKC